MKTCISLCITLCLCVFVALCLETKERSSNEKRHSEVKVANSLISKKKGGVFDFGELLHPSIKRTANPVAPRSISVFLLFNNTDTDKSGGISTAELDSALVATGTHYSAAQLKTIMVDVDTDGDGVINPDEFWATSNSQASGVLPEGKIRKAYFDADYDRNNGLDVGELETALQILDHQTWHPKSINKLFDDNDADNSNNLDLGGIFEYGPCCEVSTYLSSLCRISQRDKK